MSLMERGVVIPHPESVHVGEEVELSRIARPGVVIHPGCRIRGAATLVMDGAELGGEAPLTLDDCQVGPGVELKGGFARGSVFLDGAGVGSSAHVREACLLEEYSSCAHGVGLKHTILFPYVTLGSLINFCDCLMAGGTARKDHSEVGSSYIHFNFTPNRDKATASLIGDVPRGVMLDRRPIFLGGQGGLVGPAVVPYGTVTAAGVILRGPLEEEDTLVVGGPGPERHLRYAYGMVAGLRDKVVNNLRYIANLTALRAWYLHVRPVFTPGRPLASELILAAGRNLDKAFDERLARLDGFMDGLPGSRASIAAGSPRTGIPEGPRHLRDELLGSRRELVDVLQAQRRSEGDDRRREDFLGGLVKSCGSSPGGYIQAVKALAPELRIKGTAWLDGIVDGVVHACLEKIPSFRRGDHGA